MTPMDYRLLERQGVFRQEMARWPHKAGVCQRPLWVRIAAGRLNLPNYVSAGRVFQQD